MLTTNRIRETDLGKDRNYQRYWLMDGQIFIETNYKYLDQTHTANQTWRIVKNDEQV